MARERHRLTPEERESEDGNISRVAAHILVLVREFKERNPKYHHLSTEEILKMMSEDSDDS